MTNTFRTIKYSYIDSRKEDIIIVFPNATATLNDFQNFVKLLSKKANVLFIESGYYGITKINSLKYASDYNISVFQENLYKLLQKFSYKNVC